MTKKLKSLNPIIGTGYKTLSTIKDGEDGNIENFPDTLPKIPRLSYKRLGVSGLEIGWEFEDKIYYTYELYGSTTKGFEASEENLMFQGLASSYFYEAKPGEKWYFKARAKNTHGRYTEFSSELVAYTIKLDNLGDYVEGGSINGALIENATINNAHIKDLHADKITAGVLDADRIGANSITANHIQANAITSEKIQANAITSGKIQANAITTDKLAANIIASNHIQSGTIESGHIKSNSINSNHIQANTIQSEHIQTGAITAGSGIIADGAIGSAQISSLDANKIEAGEINTAKVKIKGENGFLFIENNTLYVVDNNRKIRCELGVIENNSNYGFVVRGADGQTIMLDHNGVHNAGITDGAIDNRKVSENANISGKKLDIDSVVKSINEDGSVTLQGTKVQIGNTTLDVKLSEQNNLITEHGQRLATQQSEITANTNAIKLKVDNQTYTEDKKNMTSSLNKATSDISVLQGQIALKVEQTDIETANNALKSEIQEDLNDVNERINDILTDVGGAIADGIIEESETIMINSSIAQLKKEKETLTQRYNYIYNLSTLASGMKSSLKTTMDTYNTKQSALVSHIQSMIADKTISNSERTTYETRLTEYSTALANINKKIEECMDSISTNKVDTAKAEIKVTTDSISQSVTNLSNTVSTKADGSTVSTLSSKVGSLETSVNGISGKVTNLETTTTTLGTQVSNAQDTADSAVTKANSAQSTANTANSTANSNKTNITNLQGEVSTVKSNIASLEVTTSGISQKVSNVESTTATLTTQVNTANTNATSAINKANTAQSTADSKAKVFTSTPTVPYKVGDLWVQGTSGDVMRCKTARTSGSYTASDWEKASKYTDDSKANAVDNKVTTLQTTVNTTNSKVATLETNLESITQRVSSTETTTTTITEKVNATVKDVKVYYAINTSSTTAPTSGWSTTPPTWENGKYIWSKTTTTLTNGTSTTTNPVCITGAKGATGATGQTGAKGDKGDTGTGITSITTEYYLSTSKTTQTGGSWTTTHPTWSAGKYLWTRSKIVYKNPTSTSYTTPVCDTSWETVNGFSSRIDEAESKLTKKSLTTTIGSYYTTSSDVDGIISKKGYATTSEVKQTADNLTATFSDSGGYNLLYNGNFKRDFTKWSNNGAVLSTTLSCPQNQRGIQITGALKTTKNCAQSVAVDTLKPFTVSFWQYTSSSGSDGTTNPYRRSQISVTYTDGVIGYFSTSQQTKFDTWERVSLTITPAKRTKSISVELWNRDTTKSVYYTNVMLEHGSILTEWSPNPNEIFDGVTTIDKDGIKVTQSNYNGYTQMKADGFYVNNGSENVISVTKDGATFKGKVTIQSGSTVPTSTLSGTISSSQLNSTITSDISTAKTTATTAQNTANTANTNATTALNTANSVNTTVNNGKTNWNNAYNRVNEWAYGAVTGSTTIDGGYIQTNTIVADKIKAGTITATQIASNTITSEKIKAGAITASMITTGTLDASKVTVTNLNASNITSGTISGDRIKGGTLSATKEINFEGGARIFGNAGAYDAGLKISAQEYQFKSGNAYFESNVYVKGNLVYHAGNKPTPSAIGALSTSGGTVSGATTFSSTLRTNNVFYGMNKLAIARGSIYIPNFGSNYTWDYIKGGASSIAFADTGVIHFMYNGTRSSHLAQGTVYLPHNGNTTCDHFRMGYGIMASPSSGSFHFLSAGGSASPLYSGTVYTKSILTANETETITEKSVFDEINNINVISTKDGLRLFNPVETTDELDSSPCVVKTQYNKEKEHIETDMDYTSAIATLWKAVQELKQENEELKEIIKDIHSKL